MAHFNDHLILYRETPEMEAVIAEEEVKAQSRVEPCGTHRSFGKARNLFQENREVKVKRVHKIHADVHSQVWKDYCDKKISFSEMKRRLKLK